MVCLYQVVCHVWYEGFAVALCLAKESLVFVLATSDWGASTLVGYMRHAWSSANMSIASLGLDAIFLLTCTLERASDVLTTFVDSQVGHATACSSILMSLLMEVLVFVHGEGSVVSWLFCLQSGVNLNWVFVSCLMMWLICSHCESGGSIHWCIRVDSTTRLQPFDSLILSWLWGAVGLRWCPLNITILDCSWPTDCDLVKGLEGSGRWDSRLGGVHALLRRIAVLIFWCKPITLLVRIALRACATLLLLGICH